MQSIISKVAAMNGVTEAEVRVDMQEAINAAGLDVEPELFVQMVAAGILSKQENPTH